MRALAAALKRRRRFALCSSLTSCMQPCVKYTPRGDDSKDMGKVLVAEPGR